MHLVAAALADREVGRDASPLPAGIPRGWRNVGPSGQRLLLDDGEETHAVALEVGRGTVTALVDDVRHPLHVVAASPDRVDLELGGTRYGCGVHLVDGRVYVDSTLGSSTYAIVDPFPMSAHDAAGGSLVSPMPGVVVSVTVSAGDRVDAGTTLVTLEAMKMEHAIQAPDAGVVVEVCTAVGDQVDRGTVLIVLEPDGIGEP